jgi:hypothetical protein
MNPVRVDLGGEFDVIVDDQRCAVTPAQFAPRSSLLAAQIFVSGLVAALQPPRATG